MKIEQTGNTLYCSSLRKGGKAELIIRGKDGRVKEMMTLIPAGGILWLRFKTDGVITVDSSCKGVGLKVEIPMPLKGSTKLILYSSDIKTATFSWDDNGSLTLTHRKSP